MRPAPLHRPQPMADDALLEADVMRFMAILGFCLMVIFALIEAIPVAQVDTRIELKNSETVAAELKQTMTRLAAAQTLAVQLHAQILRSLEVLKNQRTVQQTLTQDLATRAAAVAQLQAEYEQLARRANQTRSDLVNTDNNLRRTEASLAARTRTLRNVDASIARVVRDIDRKEQQLATLQQDIAQNDIATREVLAEEAVELPPATPPPSPRQTSEAPTERGFTLRFDSTEALQQAVRRGHTSLYVEVGNQIWRARRSGGFEPAPAPYKPYELTEPPGADFLTAFRNSAGVLSSGDERWLVKFNAAVSGHIRNRMSEANSGHLVIFADGNVSFDR